MQVFISWSGTKSKALGEVLRSWLPKVLQGVRPYFTPDDVQKGSVWRTEIAEALQASKFGIFCLTRERPQSPWMMFEAGAIANQLTTARVCPLLFGLESSDIREPLAQFQAAPFNKREMGKLIIAINAQRGDARLDDKTRDEVFEHWWQELEDKVNAIMAEPDAETQEEVRTTDDMVKEVLSLVRTLVRSEERPTRERFARRERERAEEELERSCLGYGLLDFCAYLEELIEAGHIVGGRRSLVVQAKRMFPPNSLARRAILEETRRLLDSDGKVPLAELASALARRRGPEDFLR